MSLEAPLDKQYFFELSEFVIRRLRPEESLTLNLSAETSRFCRFNEGKVRQDGTVSDTRVNAALMTSSGNELRQLELSTSLSQNLDRDCQKVANLLARLQDELPRLPPDPYARIPRFEHKSDHIGEGEPLPIEEVTDRILPAHDNFSPTGIYSAGDIIRGQAGSSGSRHWFSTPSWSMDYSLYGTGERAWKGFSAGTSWNQQSWDEEMKKALTQLDALERPHRRLPPGQYRTYLAPDAAIDLLWFLGGIFGEADLRRGSSPLCPVKSGDTSFSPLLNFSEDFTSGDTPRFTHEGESAPESTPLISGGQLRNTLIGPRSSREYGIPSNGAAPQESVRSALLDVANQPEKTFREKNALEKLDTGLYVSNLHYLNWSDRPKGRITGMTRYACFYVENGRIVAPIENLRWDDTIFRLFGSELEATTDTLSVFPRTSSYGMRSVGANRSPGLLLKSMNFTL